MPIKTPSPHLMFQPQRNWITDENGEIIVDYICRFEKLQMYTTAQDTKNLFKKIYSMSEKYQN